ncbi:C4-dicarboxylate ABC transporter [Escherichia coli]|nr:C4-dicarboxylate ABC transporter [Escherichia coli]EFN8660031.1 C4-dicarboxylate ABC transporter [Escherichia coli O2]EAB9760378.1 C4-dicarboxylate ABC transporter [Escherichia coli]EEW3595272.1 C4-dicarboxylate ABC transporter [Escherichia coli]EEW3611046.1 C4-dicarboxylate ABC transporter [Escherichia coli]
MLSTYKNSNFNVLMAVFLDFNQHSSPIYWAYFFLKL